MSSNAHSEAESIQPLEVAQVPGALYVSLPNERRAEARLFASIWRPARYPMELARIRAPCETGQQNKMNKFVVLIVEDEALIRMSAVQMLEDAGYASVEAANADEAIAILEARTDIAAVFTDVNMPGSTDGLKLAHAVRERWPPIHLIVTSGLKVPADHQLPVRGHFIQKPYAAEQLVTALLNFFGPPVEVISPVAKKL